MLAAVVREAARRFGDAPAIVDAAGRVVTYREIDQHSDAVAAAMVGRGVRAGDRVVLRLPSQPPYIVAYAAAAKIGAVTAGINPRLAPPEQDALVELADPALVFTDPSEVTELAHAGDGLGVPTLTPDPERAVAMVFTSGTTGVPKAAVFCERQLEAIWHIDAGRVRGAGAPGFGGAWGDEGVPGAPMLASTQFAHIGIMTKLPWYLALASRIHLLDRWRAADALDVVAREGITSIGGIAPQVALMLRVPDFERYDLTRVSTIVMGGAASPPALVEEATRRFGAAYSIRYSSTESGGCGTGTAFDADDDEALFTVGRPRPGITVAIRDERGRAAPDGEIGEVCLASPTTMSGYWRDDAATAMALVDGWLRTGDLGMIDDRGLLRLAGRSKEMFIRGGYNVYPMEVEAQLASHPAVAACAVVPRPDPVMGEIGVAVVVPRDPAAAPDLDGLRAHLSGRLASYKLPEAIRVVDELPYTSMHKVDRRALAAFEAPASDDD
jgi:acyl-CoA synthetase (AMP-forming)/AMP-acid ligase II